MTAESTYLAVDLGASSGRVMAGWRADDGRIELQEIRRFDNDPVEMGDSLCWDIERLLAEIVTGLRDGIVQALTAGRPVVSVGIDSWAVDFALLDDHGERLGPVVHYRDKRTAGQMERVFAQATQREIFARTGIQFQPFNTIYQLAALQEQTGDALARARHLLMIPDLVAWHLTGLISAEYTNATTTQLFDATTGDWCWPLIDRLGFPRRIFSPVRLPGNAIGPLRPELFADDPEAHRAAENIQVVAVATHDTASAVAAVPAGEGEHFAYLSCGTWSLLGTELRKPILTEEALAANFTNEGGAAGTFRFLKNIMGLWILQECRRQWKQQGRDYTWPELEQMARAALAAADAEGAPVPVFDVDDPRFLAPGGMAQRVQEAISSDALDDGVVVASVLKSLAARYREVLAKIEDLTVRRFEKLYVVGGGVQNKLLLELTEAAIGRPVIAGPAEATALGNIGLQMIAGGKLRDLADLRAEIARS